MIEAGFYGTHDESHPEGLAPGMPFATSDKLLALPACLACSLSFGQYFLQADTATSSTSTHEAAPAAIAAAAFGLMLAAWLCSAVFKCRKLLSLYCTEPSPKLSEGLSLPGAAATKAEQRAAALQVRRQGSGMTARWQCCQLQSLRPQL